MKFKKSLLLRYSEETMTDKSDDFSLKEHFERLKSILNKLNK